MDAKNRPLKVLIFGKDARTDAIIVACDESPHKPDIYVCSEFRTPRLRMICKDFVAAAGYLTNLERMVEYAEKVKPDLAIIGPEEPLELGLVDELERLGIPSFGPHKAAAQIETSKLWTRELLGKHLDFMNPAFRKFTSIQGLAKFLQGLDGFVVKPDGLTAGKGVRLSGEHLHSVNEAVTYAEEVLDRHNCVVVEEKLEGEEFSLQTITDGEHFVHCPMAQDHKRAFVGDKGPNTGGMGSYSCADFSLPFLTPSDVLQAKNANEVVVKAIKTESGKPYRGVLYGNYMATREGLKLIEYNARFADPEALNILPNLKTDFLDICRAVIENRLDKVEVEFKPKATVCKYVVPQGYPNAPVRNHRIELPPEPASELLKIYFAAVDEREGGVFITGSRAIAFVGIGDDLDEAEQIAEQAAASVQGPVTHRQDIGTAALIRSRVTHMQALRGLIKPERNKLPSLAVL